MGYDLRHLLIGAEGTLGLITAASLRLFPQPAETATAWVAVDSPAAALDLLAALRERARRGDLGLRADARAGPRLPRRGAAAGAAAAAMRRRTGGCWSRPATRPARGIGARLEAALGRGARERARRGRADRAERGAARGLLGRARGDPGGEPADRGDLEPRHLAAAVAARRVRRARRRRWWPALDPELRINCFGHLGDGNLHYNVFPPRGAAGGRSTRRCGGPVKEAVHDLVHALGGSVGGGAWGGAAEDRRSRALRRPGQARGDAGDQAGARPGGHPEPGRGAGQMVAQFRRAWRKLRPFSLGGRREGALYPDWRV